MTASPELIAAARHLADGGLVALPTETVYGLGADAANEAAVAKIFKAKGRPSDHPLIVHVAKGADLSDFTRDLPAAAEKLVAAFWPGPLTLILRKSSRVPDVVTGGQDSVGLRCPAHPLAQALLSEFARIGSGIVAAPSANKFGHVSPTTAEHVQNEFGAAVGKSILLLDGGPCQVGIESTILDLSGSAPVLLRPGAITPEQIAEVIGVKPKTRDQAQQSGPVTRVSGDLASHYAPRTPAKLVPPGQLKKEVDALLESGKRAAVLALTTQADANVSPPGVGVRTARRLVWITASTNAEEYARDLYANLRTLDAAGAAMIFVESPPAAKAWEAVRDRLVRAAAKG
jgi:L-threonylcarbamoyladenylate synthase